MNTIQQKIFFIAGILITIKSVFALNKLYPVYADDWVYSLFYESDPHRRIHGFFDLIQSQYNHYLLWGGRTVAHTIAQILLMFDPIVQDIINTIALVVFIYMIYKLSNIFNQTINGFLLLFVVSILWIFTDSMFFSSAIWITGSANYLWTSMIVLFFLYPFFRYMFCCIKTIGNNKLLILFLGILGILSGWSNENTVFAIIFFLVCFFIFCRKFRLKIPQWTIVASICFLVGFVLLFIAPGNYVRLDASNTEVGYTAPPEGFLEFVSYKLSNLFYTLKITYTLYLTVFVLLLMFTFMFLNKGQLHSSRNKKILFMAVLLILMSYIAAASMMAAPYISYRTLFFSNALLVIVAGLFFVEILKSIKLVHYASLVFLSLLLLFSAYDYSKKYRTLNFVSTLWQDRDDYIQQQKSMGNRNIIFPTTFTVHPKFLLNEMKPDPNDSRNRFYSIYMDVDSIRSDSTAVILLTP